MRSWVLSVSLATFLGCSRGDPATTDTSSSTLPTLKRKIEFLERHVKFRRGYEDLEFHIKYRNGGLFPPSPSEWDMRLVARVPPGEIDLWIPAKIEPVAEIDTKWLADVPRSELAIGIKEWYVEPQLEPRRVVGVDRTRGVVVYRNLVY